jgi:hypothetical protein
MNRFFCTVATRSHLKFVSALSETLLASGNLEPLVVLVVDSARDELPADANALRYLGFESVERVLPAQIRHYYDAFELCNALKPFLVSLLFEGSGDAEVIYLDSDLLVTGSFGEVWSGFGSASLLLSPHRFTPPAMDENLISEVDVVDMGFLNGGFAAWRSGPAAAAILEWMRTRFVAYGFCDRRRGMFVDQKLLPLLLQYFPEHVSVLRHPGINVAFWNAYEREVSRSPSGRWQVGTREVIFFHMSGYRAEKPAAVCSYLSDEMNAHILVRSPWLRDVITEYRALLGRHDSGVPAEPYRFETYKGVRLTQDYRRLIFSTGSLDRSSARFWSVWVLEHLKSVKRAVVRLVSGG